MKNIILTSTLFLILGLTGFGQQTEKDQINTLMNSWHKAAATADAELFFGSMTADAHYIGTDETEDWTKEEMQIWAKEIFKKDSAWDFKTKERHIYLYDDQKLAWFDETLDTWMGVCRGSGVVVLTDEGWKIKHYVLSVAVPNDTINDYLKLIDLK